MADKKEYLDFSSPKFDPAKALRSSNVQIPVPEAPVFDNLSKYDNFIRYGSADSKASRKSKGGEASTSAETPVRKFLPHQMPVRSIRPEQVFRNVLSRMENCGGPLEVLKRCMQKRIRVKVFVRNMCAIRGYCLAFVVAFDKHWNLALEDVHEVWNRKTKKKVPALGSPSNVPPSPAPSVLVVPKNRKQEVCERHVKQLMVRGDQVALIAVMEVQIPVLPPVLSTS